MSGAMSGDTRSTTSGEWANSANTESLCSRKIFDTASSGFSTCALALLLSGRIQAPTAAAWAGSRTSSVTRSSIAEQTDAGANPSTRK